MAHSSASRLDDDFVLAGVRQFHPYDVPADLHTPGPRRVAADKAAAEELDRHRRLDELERQRVLQAYYARLGK